VPENLLGLLKLCLLALLYLFFLRVLWAVWAEVRGPKPARAGTAAQAAPPKQRTPWIRSRSGPATRLVIDQPIAKKGVAFDIGSEMTVGRAAGCQIALTDDTYVSQLHARVFERGGQVYVEDLGSTNGTYVNGHRVSAPTPMHKGDSLQVGSTVLEAV
jgi:pSer/pThr/pTyr-binding forkhead associated (FHA) protein